MTTAQLTKAISALPDEHRFRLLLKLQGKPNSKSPPPKVRPDARLWDGLDSWRKEIFGSRITPNAVLLEREESNS
jgi:hypothetical protein